MDIETLALENTTPDPHLIKIGSTFYILIESEYAMLTDSFMESFDILFKSYYIFNLKFPKGTTKFFQFFENFVYKIQLLATGSTLEKFYSLLLLNCDK